MIMPAAGFRLDEIDDRVELAGFWPFYPADCACITGSVAPDGEPSWRDCGSQSPLDPASIRIASRIG
jgi:hypothetical protein